MARADRDVIVRVGDLARTYGETAAVDGVSFDVHRGEVFTLLGHSGCGKSTTLRMIAGLEEPSGGRIELRGQTVADPAARIFVPAERRNVGLVFQSYAVWPHMTVFENVAYPLEVRRQTLSDRQRRVREICAVVGLEGYLDRPAMQLSGGQQQRVALARALAYEPDVLLLDEPFSNLDAKLREEMRIQLHLLQSQLGTTIVYVTHDQTEALALSHRIAVMRSGTIEQLGTPHEVYEAPASYFVQDFVGRTVAFEGEAAATGATVTLRHQPDVMFETSEAVAPGSAVRVTVRPEDITVGPDGSAAPGIVVPGEIVDFTYGGDHFECLIRAAGAEIGLRVPKSLSPVSGAPVRLVLDLDKVKVWPA